LEDWGSAQKACGKSLSYRNAVVDCLSVQEQAQVEFVFLEIRYFLSLFLF